MIKKFKATSESNEMDFPLILYQHKDSLGLVQCNSNIPAVMQGDMFDSVIPREDKHNYSLPLVSLNTTWGVHVLRSPNLSFI